MKKLLLLQAILLFFSCTAEYDNSKCDEINAFYNQQQSQVLKQSTPDKNQLAGIEKERQLRLAQAGCK